MKGSLFYSFLRTEGVNATIQEMKGYFLDLTIIFDYLKFSKSHKKYEKTSLIVNGIDTSYFGAQCAKTSF